MVIITKLHIFALALVLSGQVLAQGFEATPVSSPNFLTSSFQAAKTYLANKDYGKVFAITQFYRTNFLDTADKTEKFFDQAFYQLEIYALIKVCQWDIAKSLLEEYEQKVIQLKLDKKNLEKTRQQLNTGKILMNSIKLTNQDKETDIAFNTHSVYRLPPEALERAKHPANLYVKVKNQCEQRF